LQPQVRAATVLVQVALRLQPPFVVAVQRFVGEPVTVMPPDVFPAASTAHRRSPYVVPPT
jgi:hypothetical protein